MEVLYSTALALAVVIHHDVLFLILTAVLVLLLAASRHPAVLRARLLHIAAALLLAFVLALAFKSLLAIPRPCSLGAPSLVPCPHDYSLPSLHAAIAFALAVALLGSPAFWVALLWALLVAASRLFLGVHTLTDVAAALALAVLAMAVMDRLGFSEPVLLHPRRLPPPGPSLPNAPKREIVRKLIQASVGCLVFVYAVQFGSEAAVLPVFWMLLCGLALFHLKSRGTGLPIVDSVLSWLERPSAPPGYGALTFFSGLLLTLTLLPPPLSFAMLLVLSISDALSALAGAGSPHLLPHNPQKTWAGSLAFLLSALPAYLIAGPAGLLSALLAAIIESLPLGIDDNLLIPLAGVLVVALQLA